MSKRTPLIDADGEVRELTTKDLAKFRPAQQVLPAELDEALGIRRRGPQKTPTKTMTTIRLSPEVVEYFKQAGEGWQSRLDAVLREYVAQHSRG